MLKLKAVDSDEGENSVTRTAQRRTATGCKRPRWSRAWFAPEFRRGNTSTDAHRYRAYECAPTQSAQIRVVPRKPLPFVPLGTEGFLFFSLEEAA